MDNYLGAPPNPYMFLSSAMIMTATTVICSYENNDGDNDDCGDINGDYDNNVMAYIQYTKTLVYRKHGSSLQVAFEHLRKMLVYPVHSPLP